MRSSKQKQKEEDRDNRRKKIRRDYEEYRRKLQPTRMPYDNCVRSDSTCTEETAVLRRQLPSNASHLYKEISYLNEEEETSYVSPDLLTHFENARLNLKN